MSAYATRARVAALARHRPADDPDLAAARSAHVAASLEDRVRADLAQLTIEQRLRIAGVLTAGPQPAGAEQ